MAFVLERHVGTYIQYLPTCVSLFFISTWLLSTSMYALISYAVAPGKKDTLPAKRVRGGPMVRYAAGTNGTHGGNGVSGGVMLG